MGKKQTSPVLGWALKKMAGENVPPSRLPNTVQKLILKALLATSSTVGNIIACFKMHRLGLRGNVMTRSSWIALLSKRKHKASKCFQAISAQHATVKQKGATSLISKDMRQEMLLVSKLFRLSSIMMQFRGANARTQPLPARESDSWWYRLLQNSAVISLKWISSTIWRQ